MRMSKYLRLRGSKKEAPREVWITSCSSVVVGGLVLIHHKNVLADVLGILLIIGPSMWMVRLTRDQVL